MNKNISVWRGSEAPPTNYHVWIKLNNIYIHDGNGWNPIIDSASKIDIINELPSTDNLKNGEFLLYQLGKDITISDTTLILQFGKASSFTASERDLYLVGKIKHVPDSIQPEKPKFSEKYKYKILFNANPNYYFGGSLTSGSMVLTSLTLPLTYSLIGDENNFILKCDRYYLYINNSDLCYTTSKSLAQHFKLHEHSSGKYELVSYDNTSKALNAYQGLGSAGDSSDAIRFYDKGDSGNVIMFLPQESEIIIRKIITLEEATSSKAGLMSAADKSKLANIAYNANNYTLPTASSSTKGGIKLNYPQTANNRAVQLSSERAYVNIPDVTTEQAGLMTTTDKNKLDNSPVYKHIFTGLSALASNGDGWYHIIDLGDTEAAIVQISTVGHSDVQLAVSSGWGGDDSFSLNILNSLLRGNSNYAYVKAIRVRKQKNGDSGYLRLEAKLNRTGYTDAKYRTTIVSVLTNAGHNPIVTSDTTDEKHLLLLVTTTSETLLLEVNLVDLAMIVKNIVAATASTTADGLMSAEDKTKLDNFLNVLMIGLDTNDVTVVANKILALINSNS